MKTLQKIFFKQVINYVDNVAQIVEAVSMKKNSSCKGKVLSTADVWNIQRRKNVIVVR